MDHVGVPVTNRYRCRTCRQPVQPGIPLGKNASWFNNIGGRPWRHVHDRTALCVNERGNRHGQVEQVPGDG